MNNEFKKSKNGQYTVYTLESATSGGTSAGGIASVSMPMGGVRKRGDNLIAQENNKTTEPSKPRNFVAKNAKMGGAGQHKDKKKAAKQGDVKHKNKQMDVAEESDKQFAQRMKKKAAQPPTKGMSQKEKEDKGWAKPKEQGVAEGLPQTLRKVVPGYAKREIDKKMDTGKFGKTDADKDANFQRYKKIQDKIKEQGEKTMSRAAKGNEKYGKDGMKALAKAGRDGASEKELDAIRDRHDNYNEDKDPCWKDYKQIGMKKKGGKSVPNCVPKEGVAEDHEIQMASSELQSIAKNAVNLLSLVRKYSENDGLEAWQQSKITKAADYLNSVLQSISGEQTELEGYGRNRGYAHGFASPNAPRLGSRPNHGDDERHDLDDPELQRNRQETMMYNITIDGKPINPKPIFGRSAVIAWGKEQAAKGTDLSNAMISPVKYEENVAEGAVKDFADDLKALSAEEFQAKYKMSKAEARQQASSVSEDAYMESLARKLAEKIPANAPTDVWVKDFQKADPNKYHQFKNKTPAKKAQMAVAASYAAKNPSKKK